MIAERVADGGRAVVSVGAAAALAGLAAFLSVGFIAPTRAIALVVGGVFVLAASQSLAAGVAMFAFFAFFEAIPGGYNLVRAASIVLFLAWLLALLNRRAPANRLTEAHPVVTAAEVCLIAWNLASSLWASSSGAAI